MLQGLYTSKADCWAIGVIAFLLLCDEKPFRGKRRSQVIQSIKRCRYDFGAPGWTKVSPEAKDFVSSLLVYNPDKRLSAEQALGHPWLKKKNFPVSEADAKAQEALSRNVRDNIMSYARMSELKRIAAVVVAHKSSSAEILDMRKAFDKYDEKKDGVISPEEFKLALAEFNYTDEELNDIFSQMVRSERWSRLQFLDCRWNSSTVILNNSFFHRMSTTTVLFYTLNFWLPR